MFKKIHKISYVTKFIKLNPLQVHNDLESLNKILKTTKVQLVPKSSNFTVYNILPTSINIRITNWFIIHVNPTKHKFHFFLTYHYSIKLFPKLHESRFSLITFKYNQRSLFTHIHCHSILNKANSPYSTSSNN